MARWFRPRFRHRRLGRKPLGARLRDARFRRRSPFGPRPRSRTKRIIPIVVGILVLILIVVAVRLLVGPDPIPLIPSLGRDARADANLLTLERQFDEEGELDLDHYTCIDARPEVISCTSPKSSTNDSLTWALMGIALLGAGLLPMMLHRRSPAFFHGSKAFLLFGILVFLLVLGLLVSLWEETLVLDYEDETLGAYDSSPFGPEIPFDEIQTIDSTCTSSRGDSPALYCQVILEHLDESHVIFHFDADPDTLQAQEAKAQAVARWLMIQIHGHPPTP